MQAIPLDLLDLPKGLDCTLGKVFFNRGMPVWIQWLLDNVVGWSFRVFYLQKEKALDCAGLEFCCLYEASR